MSGTAVSFTSVLVLQWNRMKADVIAIGVEDHVHLLVDYPATIMIAEIAKNVKAPSSYVTQCNQADFF